MNRHFFPFSDIAYTDQYYVIVTEVFIMKINIIFSPSHFFKIVLIHYFSSIPTVTMFWLRTSFSERLLQPTASFPDVCWPKLAERLAGWSATFQSTWPAQHTSSRTLLWTLGKGPWPHSHGTSATLASWYHNVCFHRHSALHKVVTWLHNAFVCFFYSAPVRGRAVRVQNWPWEWQLDRHKKRSLDLFQYLRAH